MILYHTGKYKKIATHLYANPCNIMKFIATAKCIKYGHKNESVTFEGLDWHKSLL